MSDLPRLCPHGITETVDVRCAKCSHEQALVEGVKAHALAHYEDGGWDVVVECWDDAQIAEQIKGTRTVKGAVGRFADVVAVWADRQADARNSAF